MGTAMVGRWPRRRTRARAARRAPRRPRHESTGEAMKLYPVAAFTMAISLLAVAPVRAAMVLTGVPQLARSLAGQPAAAGQPVTLLESVGCMGKGQVFSDAINIPSAGTLTVKLAGISWLDALQNLNCFVSTAGGGIIGNANNGALDTVQVQPGTVYVNWYG